MNNSHEAQPGTVAVPFIGGRAASGPVCEGGVIELVRQNPELYREGFAIWLVENLHVWRAFEREANKVWARGRRHYSARTIVEHLRHESMVREVRIGDEALEYKINDHKTPDLARLYLAAYPERGLFETRTQRDSERAA